MDKRDIQIQGIYMCDYLFPTLSLAEQSIISVVFSRTILVGEDTCALSVDDFRRLTGMQEVTFTKARKALMDKAILRMVRQPAKRTPAVYALHIPQNIPATFRAQRNPYMTIQSDGECPQKPHFRLTHQGRIILESIKEGLSASEITDINLLARQEQRDGEKLEDKADEIIVRRYFSEEKKRKYLIPEEAA